MTNTMTSTEYFSRASKNSNVALALDNFRMWLGWYPGDYAGATEFAGDMIETLAEADEFERCLKEGVEKGKTRDGESTKNEANAETEPNVH